jgi:tetratricopeptide (TPR) repeat protein
MTNLQIERLRLLPQRSEETWQAALFRMPTWAKDDDGQPVRPWAALCISTHTGRVASVEPRLPAERSPRLVLDALVGLATGKHGHYRPGRLEVRPRETAGELAPLLGAVGIDVVERPELRELDTAVQDLARHLRRGVRDPAALHVAGVTLEHLRAFAEAAEEFYCAARWRHLSGEDLVEVIAPRSDKGLGLATVLGAEGLVTGVGFFESRQQYERLFEADEPRTAIGQRSVWSFTYEHLWDLPIGDADAWEDQGLPVANEHAYPLLACFGPGPQLRRPTPQQWSFVEGLVRALARTSESEMDTGRWSKRVDTSDGPQEYVLALPALLEPVETRQSGHRRGVPDRRAMESVLLDMERATEGREFASLEAYQRFLQENFAGQPVPHLAGRTAMERAQDLAYAAVEAGGRRQLQLLRKALEISPDCADAYVLLAERERAPEKARELYAQGTAAGERALGPQRFAEEAGHFWGVLDTRPYMRARFGLGRCYEEEGQLEEAIGHYQELLRLNPHDNQGVRDRLAVCLLRARKFERLADLLARYDEDRAYWRCIAALAAYAQFGDSAQSRERLAAAHQANRHVRKYLLGNVALPEDPPEAYRLGDDNEAAIVASELIDVWDATPGALEWLDENTKSRPAGKRRRRK